MDIRYLDYSDSYIGMYLCETDTHWVFVLNGRIGEVCPVVRRDNHKVIKTPDAYDIEREHINATDRPSVDGFKHPDVVEPWWR